MHNILGNIFARWRLRKIFTVFENHRKSLIQYCERSELRLQSIKNAKKAVACGQTVLPEQESTKNS